MLSEKQHKKPYFLKNFKKINKLTPNKKLHQIKKLQPLLHHMQVTHIQDN